MNADIRSGWFGLPRFHDDLFDQPPVLIERTAKRWKAYLLFAAVVGTLGVMLIFWQVWAGLYSPLIHGGFDRHAESYLSAAFVGPAGIVGYLVFAVALAVGIYGRFMAWWHHG